MRGGWESTRLGDVSEVLTGPFGSLLHQSDYVSNGVPLINPINIVDGQIVVGTEKTVSQSTLDRLRGYVLSKGDIVVGRRGEIGRCAVVGADQHGWLCGTGCFFIRRSTQIDSRFLAEMLGAPPYRQRLEHAATGTTMKNLSNQALQNLAIALPPLPEQQRIVAILDEVFAGLATATANAERNLKNARELFESYVSSIFSKNSGRWEEKPLFELCALFVDSAHRTPKYQPEGIPALRPRDVVGGNLSLSQAARVSDQEYEMQSKRHRPAPGDIVYSRELSFGWAALLPEEPRVCLSQGMCLFRPKQEIEPALFLYVLNGPLGRKQAMRAAVGTAHPHINLGDIRNYRIPVPPYSERQKILAEFHALSAHTEKLADFYSDKLNRLTDLKQSILQKAFSGELTAPPSQAIQEAAE